MIRASPPFKMGSNLARGVLTPDICLTDVPQSGILKASGMLGSRSEIKVAVEVIVGCCCLHIRIGIDVRGIVQVVA